MSILNLKVSDNLSADMFLDDGGQVGVVRYDEVRYPIYKRMAKNMRGFYWSPDEIDVNKDRADFQKLPAHEQDIFTKSLLRVILLDSLQGRAPSELLNPVVSLPEIENLITTWTFFENIHSESYTHIIQNIYPIAKDIFEGMTDDDQIISCASEIVRHYDDFAQEMYAYKALGYGSFTIKNDDGTERNLTITRYGLKKKLWLALVAINALEGIRFYANFCVFWNYSERGMMEGTAKIMRLICRDENLHLSFTQKIIKSTLVADDAEFAQIAIECADDVVAIYESTIKQEKEWIKHLFRNGSMIGLNETLLCDYVDYIGSIRMKAIGLKPTFKFPSSDPLPWTRSWIVAGTLQAAPQEVEQVTYVIGGIKHDIDIGTFDGVKL